jgi:hypothetical protein
VTERERLGTAVSAALGFTALPAAYFVFLVGSVVRTWLSSNWPRRSGRAGQSMVDRGGSNEVPRRDGARSSSTRASGPSPRLAVGHPGATARENGPLVTVRGHARRSSRRGLRAIRGLVRVDCNPYDGVRNPGTVGLPLPGQEVRVVDTEGKPLPCGERGEVVAAARILTSAHVASGSTVRPACTSRCCVTAPLFAGSARGSEASSVGFTSRVRGLIAARLPAADGGAVFAPRRQLAHDRGAVAACGGAERRPRRALH